MIPVPSESSITAMGKPRASGDDPPDKYTHDQILQ